MSPDFRAHPEFGYLCLSQSFRRKARNVLGSAVAAGVVAGALVLWVRDDPGDGALTIARINEAPSSVDTMSKVDQTGTTAERSDQPASVMVACEGDNGIYVDGKCVVRRAPKPASLASATDAPQITAVPANPSALPMPVASPSAPKRESAAIAAKAIEPTSAEPMGQSAPLQKAGRRPPRSQVTGREVDRMNSGSREDKRIARTYASSGDRPRQMPAQKSAMKWARQLQECIGAVRCPAGEQLLRAFLSGGI
jgi:hypothetical protein